MKKVVVITGASSGIGEQLKKLYEKDDNIVINLSRSVEVENDCNLKVDVSDREHVFNVFANIAEKYKTIDVLINCAGFGVFGAIELVNEEQSRQIFDVNYFGTLWCCQAALKYMKKGARIINISSACALYSLPFRAMYSASKAAVNMLSYGLSMELKKYGIQVTAICPGDIKTNFSKNRNITITTNEKYGNAIELSCNKISTREHLRMNKEKACKKIYKICIKKRVKPMYIISKKYNFLYFVTRFTSQKLVLNVTNKLF
ncbi:MAG: SDR family NAD(P)-dependent oxidoreductase [Clostridiales bacterium]|nr:SDR family NAD(P)-dependent oxidoreductase [Clostridiales bacterium]